MTTQLCIELSRKFHNSEYQKFMMEPFSDTVIEIIYD